MIESGLAGPLAAGQATTPPRASRRAATGLRARAGAPTAALVAAALMAAPAALAASASGHGHHAAAPQQAVTTWPIPAPVSPRYRLLWSGRPACASILRYVRGERAADVIGARWLWADDLGERLGPDVNNQDFLRLARVGGVPPRGLYANTPEPSDDQVARNRLGLISEDRNTQWPLVEGVVLKDAPNINATGGFSPFLYACRKCSGGVGRLQPNYKGLDLSTDLISARSDTYQLYATRPAKYVSVWVLKVGASDQRGAHQAACFIVKD